MSGIVMVSVAPTTKLLSTEENKSSPARKERKFELCEPEIDQFLFEMTKRQKLKDGNCVSEANWVCA